VGAEVIKVEPPAGDDIRPRNVVHVETIGRSPSGKIDYPRLGVRSMNSWPTPERKNGQLPSGGGLFCDKEFGQKACGFGCELVW
jgi:hypothetical protein